MEKRKEYNPNSFNALDAALAFICVLIALELIERAFVEIVRSLRDDSGSFDFYLAVCISSLLTQGVIVLVAIIWARSRRVSLFSGGGFVYKFDLVQILFSVLLSFGIYFTVSYAHLQFDDNLYSIFYGTDIQTYNEELQQKIGGSVIFAYLYIYFLSPLLPCVCEEVLYRGVLMRGFRQFGATFSIVISSICFALMHGNFSQIILQFVSGLAMAAVVTLTGNFLLGAAMHFAHNFFSSYFSSFESSFALRSYLGAELSESLLIVFGVVCLVVSVAYFINLLIGKIGRAALGKPETVSLGDRSYYAKIKRVGDGAWQKVYPVQEDFSLIADGNYLFEYKGKERKVNSYSKKALSIFFIIAGIVLSIVLIIISI